MNAENVRLALVALAAACSVCYLAVDSRTRVVPKGIEVMEGHERRKPSIGPDTTPLGATEPGAGPGVNSRAPTTGTRESGGALDDRYPLVEGRVRLTREWSVELPLPFKRRVEGGDLVLWRPGITLWVAAWAQEEGDSIESRLAWIASEANEAAFGARTDRIKGLLFYSYRLFEESDDKRQAALYGFVLHESGYLQVAVYYDRREDEALAYDVFRSVEIVDRSTRKMDSR